MKISYAVTVADEIKEIQTLLPLLIENKREDDEIIVQYDNQKVSVDVLEYLNDLTFEKKINKTIGYPLNADFGTFKQHLNQNCTGEWIYQLDADEILDNNLIKNLNSILEENQNIELFFIPRINIVNGLTDAHIQKWGWNVNENGWINWPDYQWRIYKNAPEIKWKNKVHEVIEGYKVMAQIPGYESLALYHPKTIERQERQNAYYDTL